MERELTAAKRARALLSFGVLAPALLLYSLAALVASTLGARPRDLQWVYVGFSKLCLRVAGTRLESHGHEHIRPGQAYVVVANHLSNWDPPCILAALPELVLRFVAKDALMRIPIFGRALEGTGNVRVVRTRSRDDVARIEHSMRRRDPDVSMLFFAEGTRSRDGRVHDFKLGAFATALREGLPVLPIAIAGTDAVWPGATATIVPGPVAIEIGEPIAVEGLDFDTRRSLRDHCNERVRELHVAACRRLHAIQSGDA